MEDLLCVFMGCEGQYIRFAKGYDPNEERDRLTGPTWRILPGLDPSLQDLTASMLRTATHYAALEAFVDVQSRESFGLVNHALCASVRKFLQDYLVLIAQLETQFLTDDAFTLHVLNIHMLPTSQMMLQLYALAHELLKKNALLDDDDETDESSDDGVDDYDKIIDRLREGGELVPGNAASKKICKGGAVLEMITKRLEAMSGDPAARALLTALLRDASRPYMVMLNEWLHHGGISDPHAEFLVKEQKSIRRELLKVDYTDEYWDRRYTLRDKDVPPQLAGVKDKVLLAGKYLNVVRECGGVDISKKVMDVPTSFDDSRFLDNINTAYAHANASLMQLLLTTHALPARLRSLKHYFFLDPSDYFSYFLELSHAELRKRNIKAVNTSKLQSLLDLVLRQPGSTVSLDPFKEDVKVEMNDTTLVQALQRVVNITGIEQGEVLQPSMLTGGGNDAASTAGGSGDADGYASLQLDYAMPFPVSLVISRKTIWRYQALFRFLLSLHHLESQLTTTWQSHMRDLPWFHRSMSKEVAVWKRRLFTLRARMLVFVQQLLYFCTAEVIEPNWQALMSRLQTEEAATAAAAASNPTANVDNPADAAAPVPLPSRTVDELMQDHVDFLDTCLKECMLTNSKLLKASFPGNIPLFMTVTLTFLDPRKTHADVLLVCQLRQLPNAHHGPHRPRPRQHRLAAQRRHGRTVEDVPAGRPGRPALDRPQQQHHHRQRLCTERRGDAQPRRPSGQVRASLWTQSAGPVGCTQPLCRHGDGRPPQLVCSSEHGQPGHRVRRSASRRRTGCVVEEAEDVFCVFWHQKLHIGILGGSCISLFFSFLSPPSVLSFLI